MSPNKPPNRAWSPETETREEVKALLQRRSKLTESEVVLFRAIYPELYDAYVETLGCVVRSRGARGAVEREIVHDALAALWDESVAAGFTENLQARLLWLASDRAWNHVRRAGRDPATQALPTSSKESPGSFPSPERRIDLKELARLFFSQLSDEHQKVVDAVILRDLTVTEAAAELGLRRTTASSRLTAALTLLGAMVEELSPSERRV